MKPITVYPALGPCDLQIRDAESTDRAFVASRWVSSYSPERAGRGQVWTRRDYREKWNRLVTILLERSRVSVAVSPRNPDAILGFCVTEGDTLHYCYVIPQFFRGGLARELISYNLGEYPFRILTSHVWPFVDPRFEYEPLTLIEGF